MKNILLEKRSMLIVSIILYQISEISKGKIVYTGFAMVRLLKTRIKKKINVGFWNKWNKNPFALSFYEMYKKKYFFEKKLRLKREPSGGPIYRSRLTHGQRYAFNVKIFFLIIYNQNLEFYKSDNINIKILVKFMAFDNRSWLNSAFINSNCILQQLLLETNNEYTPCG